MNIRTIVRPASRPNARRSAQCGESAAPDQNAPSTASVPSNTDQLFARDSVA